MNPFELIALHEPQFTKSDTKIKDYVLNNLDIICSMSNNIIAWKIFSKILLSFPFILTIMRV